jgi:hypothetical protein
MDTFSIAILVTFSFSKYCTRQVSITSDGLVIYCYAPTLPGTSLFSDGQLGNCQMCSVRIIRIEPSIFLHLRT